MKSFAHKAVIALIISGACWSCQEEREVSSINPVNWEKRAVEIPDTDSLLQGTSYLSVYSSIYSQTERYTHDLTATVSLRNTDPEQNLYLSKADYFNTHGELIRSYFKKPIMLKPMETVEIIIDEGDRDGGTGANFLLDWHIQPGASFPLFECVMISTSGQQGLSFSTRGKRIK